MKLSIGTIDLSTVKEDKYLSVRNKPHYTGKELTRLYDKEEVVILGRDKSGWYNISFVKDSKTEEGFISDKYVKVKECSTLDYKTTGDIKIRLEPNWSTNKTNGVIKANEIIRVISIEGEWSKFYHLGRIYYAPTEMIKKVEEDYILSKDTNVYSVVDKLSKGEKIKVSRIESNYAVFVENNNEYFIPLSCLETKKNEPIKNDKVESNNSDIDQIVSLAKSQIGKPYSWGDEGPDSFDCSGLVQYVFKQVRGVKLPRVTRDIAKSGKAINRNDIQPGDIICFDTNSDGVVNHVGIYIGNDEFVHSTKPGDFVRIDKINSNYYKKAYVTTRRY